MTFVGPGAILQAERIARATDNGTMGEFRAALAAGSAPTQWVYVQKSVLDQYQQMISNLELEVVTHKNYVSQLMAQSGVMFGEVSAEPNDALDAESVALVNSLLCSVPETNYYREDEQE